MLSLSDPGHATASTGTSSTATLIIDTSDEAPLNLGSLQKLTQLEELTVTEWASLDFSKFSRLKELVLLRGTALPGLEAVRSLESLYLIDWKTTRLPADLPKLTASRLRISTSSVVDITPAFKLPVLSALTLQHLPKLDVGSGLLQLDTLQTLELEAVPWTDLGNLHSKTLEELRLLNPVESLAFIRQLSNLRLLLVDNVKDGNMAPVLAHPALKEVHLTVGRKHYTHKQKDLQAALQDRNSRPRLSR